MSLNSVFNHSLFQFLWAYVQYLQRHNETLTPFTVFVTPPLQPWITWLCLTAGMWHISCHTHTHSLSQTHAYTCIQTARRCCVAFSIWHFGGRGSVCRIGGGGGSSAGVGGLMFDWVSFVLLHTHGYTLIPSLLIPETHLLTITNTLLLHKPNFILFLVLRAFMCTYKMNNFVKFKVFKW